MARGSHQQCKRVKGCCYSALSPPHDLRLCRHPPFYHGTRAVHAPGDLLTPGFTSNYADRKLSWIYFSGTLDAAIWGCELAKGEGRERIYLVEPSGAFEDDPNLTDSDARRPAGGRSSTEPSPGNPTQSYRSRAPLRVIGEVETWDPHPPERLAGRKAALARMEAEGGPEIID
ncbi:MAG TPA: NAD(+)--rifampin ADP-ribosyltransferase [Croceibacterium sp.]